MERLQRVCPVPLQIVWHENRSSYLSSRKVGGCLHLRLHKLFRDAPSPVLEALIRYALKRDPQARGIIRQMAHLHFSQNPVAGEVLETRGTTYDLQEIYNRMLERLPIPDTTIGWSNRARSGRFRSMTFGTYNKQCRQIRINPLLDDPEVPLYFLEFIVYHEMLHAICGAVMERSGRCSIHTAEFKKREREFPDYKAAKEWAKTSLKFFKKRKSHGRS